MEVLLVILRVTSEPSRSQGTHAGNGQYKRCVSLLRWMMLGILSNLPLNIGFSHQDPMSVGEATNGWVFLRIPCWGQCPCFERYPHIDHCSHGWQLRTPAVKEEEQKAGRPVVRFGDGIPVSSMVGGQLAVFSDGTY